MGGRMDILDATGIAHQLWHPPEAKHRNSWREKAEGTPGSHRCNKGDYSCEGWPRAGTTDLQIKQLLGVVDVSLDKYRVPVRTSERNCCGPLVERSSINPSEKRLGAGR